MAEQKNIAEAVEEAAGEQLGVQRWDRPAIFRESAEAATDNDLPYWAVLVLSGAIATLGLALNSSAVVIGAMLVAPLLAPVVGLALSLAIGDGRLAIQTFAVVAGSTLAVIAIGAVLTVLLPFHTITLEISARTRPTTLDLAIAVFSGLVGAVVTVARGSRLSAAIPGVAISVALIPPLAVAGFGVGIGWNTELLYGSMLLYGANLAGIVLSGMLVFLLVGMHRPDVIQAARRWHREGKPVGLAERVDRVRWVRSLGVFQTAWARVGLVLAFAVALGIPLSETLAQIARETRIEHAVTEAQEMFERPGEASILSRQVSIGSDQSRTFLRVATTEWFGREAREAFERRASALAGEPVLLTLEQLPTRGEDLDELADLLPGEIERVSPPPAPPSSLEEVLGAARGRLQQAMETLALPEEAAVVGMELSTTQAGESRLRIAYVAPEAFPAAAEQMLRGQLDRALRLPDIDVELQYIPATPRTLGAGLDTVRLQEVAELLRSYGALQAEIAAPQRADTATAAAAMEWLAGQGIARERLISAPSADSIVRIRLRPGPAAPAG